MKKVLPALLLGGVVFGSAACGTDSPQPYAVNDVSQVVICQDNFGNRVDDSRCPGGNAAPGYYPGYADVYDSPDTVIWVTDDRGRLVERRTRDYSRGGSRVPAIGQRVDSRQFSRTRPSSFNADTAVYGTNPRGGAISRSGTGTGGVTSSFRTLSGSRTATTPSGGLSAATKPASSSSSSSGLSSGSSSSSGSSVSRGGFGSTSSSSGSSGSSYSSSSSSSSSSSAS